jgi:hypothetical protein
MCSLLEQMFDFKMLHHTKITNINKNPNFKMLIRNVVQYIYEH